MEGGGIGRETGLEASARQVNSGCILEVDSTGLGVGERETQE